MKRTILSEKELKFLENAVATYGVIVTFEQLSKISTDKQRQSVRNFTSKLSKKGWLVRIKRGVYFVAGIESLGFSGLSVYKTAQLLCAGCYVSFEAALQYHGMFDQGLKVIRSVSTNACKAKEIENVVYEFVKARGGLFYGFSEQRVENYLVKIASPEKAILDILCFGRSVHSADLVLEKLKAYKDDLDLSRFKEYCSRQPVTVKRILGFLFDKAGIDSGFVYDAVKGIHNSSLMAAGSGKFNAKWRLYYDEHFDGE
ncbi:MAG: hypothetical protein A2297_01685 [Elusimicrobia bacterium RIFOXYB2_FULL_48_7]|nr:MAG: hypothetical protein A2297_01685 [Elusimicrobia bacterium RIFOXYB2_FULL_48_7]